MSYTVAAVAVAAEPSVATKAANMARAHFCN